MKSEDQFTKNHSLNSTHYMSCNQSYVNKLCGECRPDTSVHLSYAHQPMPKARPSWNQSTATWRFTSHRFSFSRQNRFKDKSTYYTDIIKPQIQSTLTSKNCTFGKGTRRPISTVVLRNAKQKPAPDRYDISGVDEQTRAKSKGKTFGQGWKAYQRLFIKHRTDAYAEFHTENNPPPQYQVRQIPGQNKNHFTVKGRLKMYSEKMAADKNWVPGPYHLVKDRHLYGTVGLNERNFSFGERLDLSKPLNNNPEAIYTIPGFCEKFTNLKDKKQKTPAQKQ